LYYYDVNKKITVADFITYVTDKESIRDKVMDIVNNMLDEELTINAMDEYIDVVFKNDKKEEIKRLKEEIKKELDVDKKMKLVQKIAELKKEDV
jgi:hypothetical protein